MNESRLIKKTGLYFIGNFSTKIISTIIIPIYALYISAADLGFYDYTITIANMLMPIVFVAIWESILKYLLTEENEDKKEKIIGTSMAFITIMTIISFSVAMLITRYTAISFENTVYIFSIYFFYSYVQIFQYYCRGLRENKVYVFASVVSSLVKFMCIILLVVILKWGLIGLLISDILGQSLAITIMESKIHIIRNIKIKNLDIVILKQMVIYSGPLVLNLSFLWIINGFGRLLITNYIGQSANGIYSFASKFSTLIATFGSVISMALIEEAILKINDPDVGIYFSNVLEKVLRFFLTICSIALPIITIFYSFISDTEYFEAMPLTFLFLLYGVSSIMGTNVGSIFQAMNRTDKLFITTLIGGLVTFTISMTAIKPLGIAGVAIGQLVGSISVLITRFIFSSKMIKLTFTYKKNIFLLIFYCVLGILCPKANNFENVLLALTAFIVGYFSNKDELIYSVNYVKAKMISKK